jgi:hypothetical protein
MVMFMKYYAVHTFYEERDINIFTTISVQGPGI